MHDDDDLTIRVKPAAAIPTRVAAVVRFVANAEALAEILIARIDRALSDQVGAIMHHPRFQSLEAGWRGLAMLCATAAETRQVKVRLLDLTWAELGRDLARAVEFDQSLLFGLIYSAEIGSPGGEPFGMIVADYDVSHRMRGGEYGDDIAAIQSLAAIGAAAFCPILLAAAPDLLEIDRFARLGTGFDPAAVFENPEHLRWRTLRAREDTRFIGLTLPRILLRTPYRTADRRRLDGFLFAETPADAADMLWGGAGFALAAIIMRHFDASGWFADLRGVPQDRTGGGQVFGLPVHAFPTDAHRLAGQPSVEVQLTGAQEQALSGLGLIPIVPIPYSLDLVFNSNASLHEPPRYDRPDATWNARISAMLQYVLCVSRFAHYLLVMMRDRIGSFATAADIQRQLNTWLAGYCLGTDDAAPAARAKFPLREAAIEVHDVPGRPGSLGCTIRLKPHFQLDSIATSFRLVTQAGRQAA